jgi:hypothetical protein
MTRFALSDPSNVDLQVMVAGVCAQLAFADASLKDKDEASKVVRQGLDVLAELEKKRPLPPSGIETLKLLKELERALPGPEH